MNRSGITLKDLARILNLSESTVSRALHDHPRISKATKQRVKILADQLDYFPNQLAVNLLQQRTNTIGVVAPRIGYHLYATAISGMEAEAEKEGFNIIICQSAESYERERAIIQELMHTRIAGLIVSIASKTGDFEHFARIKRRGYPLVFFNRECQEIYTDRVVIDNTGAAREAVSHLIKTGCRRIAYIGGPEIVQISKKREKGYREALEEAGLTFNPQWVVHSEFNPASAQEAAHQLLSLAQPPDAILAYSDQIAQNVMYIAKQRGIRIPEQLSIIGFNNEPADALLEPSLTSIEQPCFEMGRLSAELLITQILRRDSSYRTQTRVLQAQLILRDSTRRFQKTTYF